MAPPLGFRSNCFGFNGISPYYVFQKRRMQQQHKLKNNNNNRQYQWICDDLMHSTRVETFTKTILFSERVFSELS